MGAELLIIDTKLEPVDSLNGYHLNPRRGDVESIARSIKKHGQFKAIVVNLGNKSKLGYKREILAGNHTWQAFRMLEREQILVHWVDVDDDEAAAIVLNDNASSDKATNDDRVLAELIATLPNLDDLVYTPYDLEELATRVDLDGMGGDDEGSGSSSDGSDTPLDEDAPLDEHADSGDTDEAAVADPDKGKGLELWGTSVGEPDITPGNGTTWQLGEHILVVCDVHKDFGKYAPHMDGRDLLWPYPSLLAPFVMQAQGKRIVMVQPNAYLAGWTITKWQRLTGETAVEVAA